MELRAYWEAFRRHIWLILGIVALSVGSATMYRLFQAPVYAATTTLFLNPAVAEQTLGYQNSLSLQSLANSYAAFMRTSTFAERIATTTGVPLTQEDLAAAIASKYTPDTQYFQITALATTAQSAQQLANAAAHVLIYQNAAQTYIAGQLGLPNEDLPNSQYITELNRARQAQLILFDQQLQSLQLRIKQAEEQEQTPESKQILSDLQAQLGSTQLARIELLKDLIESQRNLVTNGLLGQQTAIVIDVAPLPSKPTTSSLFVLLVTSGASGLALAFGLVLLLEYLDTSFRTPEALAHAYGLPPLAVVSRAKAQLKLPPGIVDEQQTKLHAAFDCLQLALRAAGKLLPLRSLLVTSALPGEGKTFIAANLAVGLARGGQRVILVDASPRVPQVARIFATAGTPGLMDLLVDPQLTLMDVLGDTSIPNLQILPAGTPQPQPAALFASPRMVELHTQLVAAADVVLFDVPATSIASDALAIAMQVDGVIQVVQAAKTSAEAVLRSKAALMQMHVGIVGPIINMLDRPETSLADVLQRYTAEINSPAANHVFIPGRRLAHVDDLVVPTYAAPPDH